MRFYLREAHRIDLKSRARDFVPRPSGNGGRFLIKLVCAAAILLLLTAPRGSAHHSFAAEYDEKKLIIVSGTVTAFEWINPHAGLYVEGKDALGTPGRWRFEMGAPGGLLRRGWKQDDLKAGDYVTVDGYPAKDAINVANARTITLPDGRKLFGGFETTPGNPFK